MRPRPEGDAPTPLHSPLLGLVSADKAPVMHHDVVKREYVYNSHEFACVLQNKSMTVYAPKHKALLPTVEVSHRFTLGEKTDISALHDFIRTNSITTSEQFHAAVLARTEHGVSVADLAAAARIIAGETIGSPCTIKIQVFPGRLYPVLDSNNRYLLRSYDKIAEKAVEVAFSRIKKAKGPHRIQAHFQTERTISVRDALSARDRLRLNSLIEELRNEAALRIFRLMVKKADTMVWEIAAAAKPEWLGLPEVEALRKTMRTAGPIITPKPEPIAP